MEVGLEAFLAVALALFAVGFFGVLLRRNVLMVYMSLELMLNGANVALIAFSRYNGVADGAVFVFFIITVAAAEVTLGLAILVALWRRYGKGQTISIDAFQRLKG